jgi:hypothetical protein
VVRGSGHAQSTHLKTKGKSRYGSRLRLQNAQRQLEETSERLGGWWDEFGPFAGVFISAPVRLGADLQRCRPELPFPMQSAVRIPHHVHRPGIEELERIRRKIVRGRLERP